MNKINQDNALKSQRNYLTPKSTLIDGRTEQDMLGFMANFASLINFYDRDNNKYGDWTPFLLKDPIFLLALISATNFKNIHSLYLSTCSKLKQNLYKKTKKNKERCNNKINDYSATNSVNQLFGQLTGIYLSIQKWAYYMERSSNYYELKTYLFDEIKDNYGTYLWALLTFQKQLSIVPIIKNVEPVDSNVRDVFKGKLWEQGKNKGPYWEILGLNKNMAKDKPFDLSKISACNVFEGIQVVGDQLFPFLRKIIDYALVEFDSQKVRKSKYPDTILLRTFINLLKIQQNQLNKISQKHLEFYYNNILKQTQEKAIPDQVYACAELSGTEAIYKLPKKILFDAGTDTSQNPIVFKSNTDVTLNPAKITTTLNLFKAENKTENTESLYLKEIQSPTEVHRKENGEIETWSTFGEKEPKKEKPVTLGFAFASPILFLREGQRSINITFTFSSYVDLSTFCKANIYLSTKDVWLKIDNSFISYVYTKAMMNEESNESKIKLTIELDANLPAIESFEENPDGLSSEWPLFKVEFNEFKDLDSPPIMTSLEIDVNVKELRTFQLYNDFGALSTEAPFQLFGPTPNLNSNFIIGNSEIFSKPLKYLEIKLDWDNLPQDFKEYYDAYNKYIAKISNVENEETTTDSLFTRIARFIINLFTPNTTSKCTIPDSPDCDYYNNKSFQVEFKWLKNRVWAQFSMPKFGCNEEVETENSELNSDTNTEGDEITPQELFCVVDEVIESDSNSKFRYEYNSSKSSNIKPYPNLQKTELEYTEASTSGFMKIQLVEPEYGFGNDIYAQVVSFIAIKNAAYIADECYEKLLLAPNPPFIPEVTIFTANYSATHTYKFNEQDEEMYPYQCYYYTPFKNFLVCNQSMSIPDYTYQLATPIITKDIPKNRGISLYPAYKGEGTLLLGLEGLITPEELNMYFELVRNYTKSMTLEDAEVGYAYMEEKNWNNLPVLYDGTKNFSCSGIIQLNVPENISTASYYMPEDKYWLSITVSGDLDLYSQTAYLNTNGFRLTRSGDDYLENTEIPKLESDSILGPLEGIPEIASIIQPFPSFGGKPAENETVANQRISARLKTKNRVVSTSDFFNVIKENFNDIYYSKTSYSKTTNTTNVYLVKKVDNYKSSNAFMPLVDVCRETSIKNFLVERASGLSNIEVSNFLLEFVTVIAMISVKQGFEFEGVMKAVNQGLMLYLSPWISTDSAQVQIDQGLSTSEIAKIINEFDGVDSVDNIQLETVFNGNNTMHNASFIVPVGSTTLFVPSAQHNIKETSNILKLITDDRSDY
ncbi:hypothetical protein [uncultured Winogradskyella sp.]|uniref:hypothetical protein n=1 Tax=uncultured Winogradskyella sp. TaxID=395353 RepID=UPI002621211C|nr:hypothetical protein [uncultured Winogradskyella sp.]